MNKGNDGLFSVVFVIALLALVSLACWGSNEGAVAPLVTQGIEQAETSQPSYETFRVGDLIYIDEHTIQLNSIEYRNEPVQGSVLVAVFTIENRSASILEVRSSSSFSAKTREGVKLDHFHLCDVSSFSDSILPGDNLHGGVCWKNANPDDGIKIYYTPYLFDVEMLSSRGLSKTVWVLE